MTRLKTSLVTVRIETEFVFQFHKHLSDLRPSAVRHGRQRGVYVAILQEALENPLQVPAKGLRQIVRANWLDEHESAV